MAQSFKTIGFLDMLKGLPSRLFRSQAETERDKALTELFTRNDPHLLDDIGLSACNSNQPNLEEERRRHRPWQL